MVEGVGEKPHRFQEVYCTNINYNLVFYICRDAKQSYVSGSEHLATRCVIGRGMLN